MATVVEFQAADAHPDHRQYRHFTGPACLQKAINSLLGIVAGIAVDGDINDRELSFLQMWLDEHRDVEGSHPYNELMPAVGRAIADGVLSEDEKEDILWLCERLRSAEFFDAVTADMQRLHAMLGGIAADGEITQRELEGLQRWLGEHEQLRTRWPYDEVDGLVTSVLADRRIDRTEHIALMSFFQEFTALLDDRTITRGSAVGNETVIGICAAGPEIVIAGSAFAFTGASYRYSRAKFSEVVTGAGGTVMPNVSAKLDYLIIGAGGNSAWLWWATLVNFLKLQTRTKRLRRWPSRKAWAHGNAARHQQEAMKAAALLGEQFVDDLEDGLLRVVQLSGKGNGPVLRVLRDGRRLYEVWLKHQRVVNLRGACVCAAGKGVRPAVLKTCGKKMHAGAAASLLPTR
jgi:hypothetical protein